MKKMLIVGAFIAACSVFTAKAVEGSMVVSEAVEISVSEAFEPVKADGELGFTVAEIEKALTRDGYFSFSRSDSWVYIEPESLKTKDLFNLRPYQLTSNDADIFKPPVIQRR